MAQPNPDVERLHERAADNLRYIRETMERSGSFSAVPGWAGMAMGGVAVVSALLAHQARARSGDAWLAVWLACLVLAVLLGALGLASKARRHRVPLFRGPARRFALTMCPPLLVGALLTLAMFRWGFAQSLPGVWMLSYGAGVSTGGAFSVPIVPVVGVLFMLAGAITLFLPAQLGDFMMAASFGGLHIVFGWIVARRHGG
jgi:hypothetical protein